MLVWKNILIIEKESKEVLNLLRILRENEKSVLFANDELINILMKKFRELTFEKDRTFLALYLKNKGAALNGKYDKNGDQV